jgi:hypothetical protein
MLSGDEMSSVDMNVDHIVSEERYVFSGQTRRCPNPLCDQFTLTASLYEAAENPRSHSHRKVKLRDRWNLLPQSKAIPMPDYIPKIITTDYEEACTIVGLSPKASATLSRRALQGMIRDYWGISKSRLYDEINAIKDKVDPDVWSAIDAVRSVGNIGAHMERDINVIVDVEENEAELLIGLLELLAKEWYIARHVRQERLSRITKLAEDKKPTQS